MKKALILTASTGGGHNKAALALRDEYIKNNYEVVIVNILKLLHSVIENVFIDGYGLLYSNFPRLYSSIYRHSDHKIFRSDATKLIGRIFRKKILDIINAENPSIIIGTHAFSVGIMNHLKKRRRISIPFICIVTDFKAHAAYFSKYVDAYITGSIDTNLDMINKGIPKNKLYSYGIPVDRQFILNDKKNIQYKNPIVMIMGGSLCNLDMIGIVDVLCQSKARFDIITVCGKDKQTYQRVKRYADSTEDRNIEVYSYTDKIWELMGQSDILITKPGGLTISEALVSQIPLVIPHTLPGQEEDNLDFLLKNNIAYYSDGIDNIGSIVTELIEDNIKLKNLIDNMKKITSQYSISKIIELSNDLCN